MTLGGVSDGAQGHTSGTQHWAWSIHLVLLQGGGPAFMAQSHHVVSWGGARHHAPVALGRRSQQLPVASPGPSSPPGIKSAGRLP